MKTWFATTIGKWILANKKSGDKQAFDTAGDMLAAILMEANPGWFE